MLGSLMFSSAPLKTKDINKLERDQRRATEGVGAWLWEEDEADGFVQPGEEEAT